MRKSKSIKSKLNAFTIAILIMLVLYTTLMFGLFMLGINISFKHESDLELMGNVFGLPNVKLWALDTNFPNNVFGNYLYVFNFLKVDSPNSYILGLFNKKRVDAPIRGNIITSTLYTILYAGGGAMFSTFMPMFMGYLCARYKNKVSSFIYALVLFVIATPIVGALPSTINLMRSLSLYDSFIGEWIRRSTFTNMYFLIFYAFFSSMSDGFSEAAEIDGASQFSVMFRIYIPLASSIFFTIYLIIFVAFWNDYTTPMMFLPSKPTLSYLIYYKITIDTGSTQSFQPVPRQLAALMTFAIPIIVIFSVFNKRLMTNLTMGGMKE